MNFFKNEIPCRCGCGAENVSENLIVRLNRMREYYGKAVFTTSICRCVKHNILEGGSETSSHISTNEQKCTAADLRAVNALEKLKLVKAALMAGFSRIVLYKDKPHLVHVDVDFTKPDGLFLR